MPADYEDDTQNLAGDDDIYVISDEEIDDLDEALAEGFSHEDIDVEELTTAIENGDRREVERLANPDGTFRVVIAGILAVSLLRAFQRMGQVAATKLGVAFNPLDPLYTSYLYRRVRETVGQFATDAKSTLQGIISRGVREGVPPSILAARIRTGLYLLDRQERQLEALAASLRQQGLSESQRNRRLTQLLDQMKRMRAQWIAVHQIIGVASDVQILVWNSAITAGLIDGYTMTWVTARDERVCPTCGPLHGVTIRNGQKFPGGFSGPPAHVRCRCRLAFRKLPR